MALQNKNPLKYTINRQLSATVLRLSLPLLTLWMGLTSINAQSPKPFFLLDQNETGTNKNYVARDSVKLQKNGSSGFSFKAEPGKSFSAKIDPGLLFPPKDGTYKFYDGTTSSEPTITKNYYGTNVTFNGTRVGSIPGQFAVSPSGAATYNIPIDIPAGINGMQPNISLAYNSQGGNGVAGWGWNISGVSMISRVPQNYYYDGEKTGMIWDKTSPLALDGQRLIEIQRWGNDSVEYDTQAKSTNRIVAYQIKDWGAVYFKVYTKSGQIIQYGNPNEMASYFPVDLDITKNYLHNQSWSIVSITDNFGNKIDFSYKNSSSTKFGEFTFYRDNVIDKISYGANLIKGTSSSLSIQFAYDKRSDSTDVCVSIGRIYNNKILSSITVVSNGKELKQYIPTYNFYDNKSHLESVSLLNDKKEKINPVNFQWSNNNYIYRQSPNNLTFELDASPLINSIRNDQGYNFEIGLMSGGSYFGDIDGDGDQDAIIKYKLTKRTYNGVLAEYFGNKYSYDYKYVWVAFRNDSGNFKYLYAEEFDNNENKSYILLDRDHDGIDEFYIGKSEEIWGVTGFDPETQQDEYGIVGGRYIYKCYRYSDGVFSDSMQGGFSLPNNSEYVGINKFLSILPADFLGMGDPQFLVLNNYNGVTTPLAFSEPNCLVKDKVTGSEGSDIYISDFNGNGKSELVYVHDNIKIYEFQKNNSNQQELKLIYTYAGFNHNDQLYAGDFNGDGNTDFLIRDYPSNTWKFLMSTGSQLIEKQMANTLTTSSEILIADVNKDGMSDILFIDDDWGSNGVSNGTYIKLLVSNGKGFEEKLSQKYTGNSRVVAFLTTGRFDNTKYDNIILGNAFDNGIINISNNTQFDKVTKFKDSYSNSINVDYDICQSNQIKVFENGIDENPNSDRKTSATVYGSWDFVSSVSMISGDNSLAKQTDYYFYSPIINRQGKGFLGYLKTITEDVASSIVKVETNEFDYLTQTLYPYSTITKLKNSASNISEVGFEYYPTQLNGKRFELNLKSQLSKDVLNDLTTKTEYLSYDNFGNPKSIKITKGDIVKVDSINYIRKGAWCDNNVKDQTSTTTVNNETYIRRTQYAYNNKGSLIKQITDSMDINKVTTEYKDFDDFGHARTIEVTANGVMRASNLTFTPSGRFVSSKRNALQETTSYVWDETMGLLDSELDYRNNKTEYKYDSWGALAETIYPTGIRKVQTVQWAKPNNLLHATYCIYSETSGNTPVTVWFDAMGRELQKDTYGLKGNKISISTEYYSEGKDKGKLYRVSEPYFESNAENKTWAKTLIYDLYGRSESVITPLGTTSTSYDGRTVTVTSPEGTKKTVLDASGQLYSSTVNGKTVTYNYYPSGLTKSSTPQGGQAVQMVYDLQGKRIKLIDPDAGLVRTEYNGFGELTKEVQKIHQNKDSVVTINTYDSYGLLQAINRNNVITTYTYDPQYKSRIKSIEIPNKNRQEFTYDAFDRVTKKTEIIAGRTFESQTEYDYFGRTSKEIYPSGYATIHKYDQYSNLKQISDNKNHTLWTAEEENAKGQLLKTTQGGRELISTYYANGLPENITSHGIIDQHYEFDANTLNLYSREDKTDAQHVQKEFFGYDGMNRLTNWDVYSNGIKQKENYIVFDDVTGGIKKKSDLTDGKGNVVELKYGEPTNIVSSLYNPKPGPHALTSISAVPHTFPTADLAITYTDFRKIATLHEGNKDYELTYGVDDQRRMSDYKVGGQTKLTRYYLGDYEEEVDATGNIRKIHYLSGAILIQNHGVDSLLYTYSDFQGSLLALTDETGKVVERYAYDPWGARRNPDDWSQADIRTKWVTDRGYTGHEHLDAFGIINMNGRVYDPFTAQFFSPDPQLQSPANWLNYNRYTYCYGNPFKYTDPSGEFLVSALLIGAFINGATQLLSGNVHSVGQLFGAVAVGAAAGAAGACAGNVTNSALGLKVGIAATKGAIVGAAGGFAGGFVGGAGDAWLNGASFGDGLFAGLKGAGIGALTGGLIGGICGGINSIAHNGNFWTGKNATFEQLAGTSAPSQNSRPLDPVNYDNTSARVFSDNNFGRIPKLDALYADGSHPSGYTVRNNILYNSAGKPVNGVTVFNGVGHGYNVYLSQNVFISKYTLYCTMGHEYGHILINTGEGVNYFDNNKSHAAIYKWEYNQAYRFGLRGGFIEDLEMQWDLYIPYEDARINRYLFPYINANQVVK